MTRTWLHLCRAAVLGLPLLAALPAHAQYSWVDEHGTRVFSDQPPPPNVPAKRILKAPRVVSPYAEVLAAPEAAAPADKAPADGAAPDKAGAKKALPKGPQTLAEREADFAKRTKERQEADAKAAEQASALARECVDLRRNLAELTAGQRVTRINAAGEKEYVPDDDRERMIGEARRAAAKCR